MPMFRKKPVVIEARQFANPHDAITIAAWLLSHQCTVIYDYTMLKIYTDEGWMYANIGDWIIKGIKGEFYPCKPDVFEETYESAGEYP